MAGRIFQWRHVPVGADFKPAIRDAAIPVSKTPK